MAERSSPWSGRWADRWCCCPGGLGSVFPCLDSPLGACPAFCLGRGQARQLRISWPTPGLRFLTASTDRCPALSRNPCQAWDPGCPRKWHQPWAGLGGAPGEGLGGVLGLCSGKDNSQMEGVLALAWPGLLFPTTSEGRPGGLLALVSPHLPRPHACPTAARLAFLSTILSSLHAAWTAGCLELWPQAQGTGAPWGHWGCGGAWGHQGGTGHMRYGGTWGHLGTWGMVTLGTGL